MTRLRVIVLACVVLGGVSPTVAQTSGTAVEAGKTLLSPDKQAVVREHVLRTKQPVQEVGALTVGATVAPGVDLVALPEDIVTEVPKITSFKFVVAPNVIAVVDPETRQVVQLISR